MIRSNSNQLQGVESEKINDDRYEKIMEEVQGYAIVILNTDGIIENLNPAAEEMKGYESSDVIGKSFKIFYRKEDQHVPERLLKEASKNHKVKYEGWSTRKDGTAFWSSICLTALHNDINELTGFLEITRDLSGEIISVDNSNLKIEEIIQRDQELKKSEERYHQMIDEVEDYAIILLDVDGNILHWNKGAERIKGYKPNEAIGKSFTIFYPDEEKRKGLPFQLLGEAKEKGRVLHEGWRLRKDGTKFWGTVAITALHGSTGEIIGFTKVTRDLTSRKLAEDELLKSKEELEHKTHLLAASEERYHRMIEEVQDYAIILLDKDGKILNWNKGAEKIKGYKPEEIIGNSFTIFYTKEDVAKGVPFSLLKEATDTGRAEAEGWRVRKDNTKFWGSIVITALHNKQGEHIGFSKVTRDLTERKIAEETLKQYTQKLERNNEELEQFAYVASHDLKEPLRKIITFGNLLETNAKELLDEKSQDYVARMQNSASRMMSLIEDLLAFSRVNRPTEGFELIDLNQLVSRVLSDLEVMIQSRRVKIHVGKLPKLEGRKSQIGQLFQNLISNAVKFNDKPEPVVSITSTSHTDMATGFKYATIEIHDNGIGFESIYKHRIFEIFQRLHGKSEYPGTGIGLAICKNIVEAHGGTIIADATVGKGATFTMTFPLPS